MKTIPEIDLPDAKLLSPLEMNAIPFDTGTHSSIASVPAIKNTNNL